MTPNLGELSRFWKCPKVSTTSAAISIVLFALHIYRRLYENLFVSVFSSSHMNIMHYIVGHTHYWGAMMLLIAHFPAFSSSDSKTTFSPLEFCHIIGMFLYLYGFIVQHQSLRILAGLRSDRGKDAQKHKMPAGGMFEVVSCPHMMAEVLVYVGILFVLQKHTGWLAVTVWVICNQIQVALMNHKWYQETFKDYPRNRKAIFPGVL
ncbi:Steroid 5 alpha-reductase 3 [Halocaridina rubra]|uniref:Polyprenal reductase n=1 Tax=Halocaridina rubra TaxID=373956 RepID=A0AAN9A9K5_HALRR